MRGGFLGFVWKGHTEQQLSDEPKCVRKIDVAGNEMNDDEDDDDDDGGGVGADRDSGEWTLSLNVFVQLHNKKD